MKKNYFILLFMFIAVNAFAQFNVNINVTDASAVAIENADVTFDSTTLQTDSNGDVTFPNVADGTYNYTISKVCYLTETGTISVSGADANEFFTLNSATTAPVFVSISDHPIIGSWVDGHINLNDGTNNYDYDVTEFDNIVSGVAFGTYNYTFSRDGACDATGSLTVDCGTIDAMSGNVPLFIVSEDSNIDASVTQNAEVLTANASGASISYQWIDCDNGNAPISGETNQTFTATTNGNYAVIITDSNCPGSVTSSCYNVDSLSLNEFNSSFEVSVYPNPAIDEINVDLNRSYNYIEVQIFSITGQLVNNIILSNKSEFKINVSELPSAIYLIKVNADGNNYSSQIVKK